MPNKVLTIDVKPGAVQNGTLDRWTTLANTTVFINNIIINELAEDANVGKLVSGIPSAFARVDLFKTAISHLASGGDADSESNNLLGYYAQLVDEWYGFIAAIALDYAHITVRRIDLAYSEGNRIDKTSPKPALDQIVNIYEPKGAFGNMLLGRASRWREQGENQNQENPPFINVIKYREQVVGATAPESLLFTSTGYKCEPSPERPWVSAKTGKFCNPLNYPMTAQQLASLYAYVGHILSGLPQAEEYYSNLGINERVDYSTVRLLLEKWKKAIEAKAADKGYDLTNASIPPVSAAFTEPFKHLFCYQDSLYGREGVISDAFIEGSIKFDPKTLLLDERAHIARLDLKLRPEELKDLPVLVLTAAIKGTNEKAYFALPLSAGGLNVFGKNVAALVGMQQNDIKSSLKATFDPSVRTGNLEVELTLVTISGTRRQFRKVYTSDGEIKNKDILIWPNFISPMWDAYFMYSELPHNGKSQTYRAYPFVGKIEDGYFRIAVDETGSPILLCKEGQITVGQDVATAKLLVRSTDAVADNAYKYEIYRSNVPFKGVRLQSPTGDEGGYLLINYSSAQGKTDLPHDWMLPGSNNMTFSDVRLGIDFGSTNTSIAYSNNTLGEQAFIFSNQRVSLMGREMPGMPTPPPTESQIFFFPGKGTEVPSNAINSVLTLHDNRRLPDLANGETLKMRNEQEVIGGFPCFAENLPFINSDNKTISLRYPCVGEVTQIHNMKWEDTDDDIAHKSAFLRTLMLQVYANLFEKGLLPKSVKWSYPSSMAGQLLYSYQQIWDSLRNISPLIIDGQRKDLEISRYTDTRSFGSEMGEGAFGAAADEADSSFSGNSFNGGGGFDSGSGFSNGFGGGGFEGGFNTPAPKAEAKTAEQAPADDLMPDDPNAEVRYEPEPMYADGVAQASLSEAESVANFISKKYGDEENVLNLCFDVGGSTTDISALFYLCGNVTMVKQNSVRFAAQRVSQAVGRFPSFKRVLTEICQQYGIKMVGLNMGNDTYGPQTASYFFNQIVNKLKENQLEDFYRKIAAYCPQLMCVNMYVTGLLMYYAGQIAHKLIDDLKRTPDTEWEAKTRPNVRVTFAGKGSRLFQWLSTINPGAANQYYGGMFVRGYGVDHLKETLAGWQVIELPKLDDPDIKYEVSKGLAKGNTKLMRPKHEQPSEIIGEAGFEVRGKDNVRRELDFVNSLTPAMVKVIGTRFSASSTKPQAQKFTDFCGFFYQAASQLFGWNVNPNELKNACQNLKMTAYVQNMPEFRDAKEQAEAGKGFNFVAPIIILEGMKFYDETLLKLIK